MPAVHRLPLFSLLLQLVLLVSYAMLPSSAQPPGSSSPADRAMAYRFKPSMLVIIFVLITAFFFVGFFSIYIRQCAGSREAVAASRGVSRRNRGLDPAAIEAFPVLDYSAVKAHRLGKGELECAVCLNEFEDDEELRLLPACQHAFHPPCIDAWLAAHTTCPVCRSDLAPGPAPEAPPADPVSAPAVEADPPPESVAISVDHSPEVSEAAIPCPARNRPIRSKSSRRPYRIPRSHSTGHSLVQPGENVDRFTLRLPDHVLKEIMSGRLNRTTSLLAFPTATDDGSVTGGGSRRWKWLRGGGDGSSRGRALFPSARFERAVKSDRWVFSMAPPFFTRTGSFKSVPKSIDVESSGGSSRGGHLPAVKPPFDCFAPKADLPEAEPPPARSSSPIFTVSGT